MNGTKRIFSAIEIPKSVKTEVGAHIAYLRDLFPKARPRWVSPEKMHLTLRFIAKASDKDVGHMIGAQTAAAGSTGPFDLAIEGAGVFPNPRSARVLWLGLSDDEPIRLLKASLDAALAESGMPAENREFTPHLTIARLRSPREAGPLAAGHLEKGFGPVAFGVSRIVLFESSLRASGPVYSVLHSAELKG